MQLCSTLTSRHGFYGLRRVALLLASPKNDDREGRSS